MKSIKSINVFAFYFLLIALIAVGIATGFSNAAPNELTQFETNGGTVPTRTPNSAGTVPTRTPSSGDTLPTRTPNSGETIPTRTPVSGNTIPARTPSPNNSTSSEDEVTTSNSGGRGSMIILNSASADSDDWVVVEWLAGDGNWYQVDGWRGHINNGELIWWVASENLGQGPFRWIVYSDESETTILQASEQFVLPAYENEIKSFWLEW